LTKRYDSAAIKASRFFRRRLDWLAFPISVLFVFPNDEVLAEIYAFRWNEASSIASSLRNPDSKFKKALLIAAKE
jgi:hypothetical protein